MEVRTSYQLADIWSRVFALIIDNVVVAAIQGIFGANDQWLFGSILGFIVGMGYQWYFLTRHDGQTLGKMAMNIRVVKADGTAITDVDVFLRYVGYLLNSAILGLGWLWALVDPERQGLHDKLARTYVVTAERENVNTVYVDKTKNETV